MAFGPSNAWYQPKKSNVANYDHCTQTIHLNWAEEPDLVKFAKAVFEPEWDAGLVPFWKKRQAEFFERSHDQFVAAIQAMEGPDYFRKSVPALIENNRWLMEQQTLTFSINRLPKRPPIIFGD